ncbi:L-seryl-tRNA(Sec) selenium transferase [Aquibacillus saliphilus]|uniref:L-seryl-tRNA(Sec) selenium transferase n=1 Tax=Aquibacillus saliphilus TaxID=1909422 RepID=UPI001CF009A7|nr:L-seryl-tRNA(Sec) selenium transferase [Aquibacillus saliphilus]
MKHLLRELPPVHELQKSDRFTDLVEKSLINESQVTKVIQGELDDLRDKLLACNLPIENGSKQTFIEYIWNNTEEKVRKFQQDRLVRVINATGTVLHTNLGRARLSEQAISHVASVAGSYSNLEYRISEGKRGSRHDILEDLLTEITGAEAAMVVNNNAAAVYLVLRALAKDKEVIVSRGQLVEIGGSFRVSSIMEESDAQLVEVGTTNKTHLYDYQNAISDNTSMILKVHTSNFKTIGFTESVSTDDLVNLKNQHPELIFYEDLGSGSLYDFKESGIGDEPVVRDVIKSGVDLVSFSGDKLLGGPQAGIIVGKKEYIQSLKKHQLARVLRVDKMTFAGLEKTLRAYLSEQAAVDELPTVRDILKTEEHILEQVNLFSSQMGELSEPYNLEIIKGSSQIGGGTMPGVELPTYLIAVKHKNSSTEELAKNLRNGKPSVVTRIKDDKVLLDFRTITEQEMPELLERFGSLVRC